MGLTLHTAAHKLLEENCALKKGERVVVVTDRKSCPVFKAICTEARKLEGEVIEARLSRNRTHSAPIPELRAEFSKADIIIGVTDKSISNTPQTLVARKKHNARVVSMVEVGKALFLKAMKADQKKIRSVGTKLANKLRKSKLVTITTPAGANFKIKTVKRCITVDDGDSSKKGVINNLPYGEVTMAPIQDVEGTIAIDFAEVKIYPQDMAKVFVKNGKINDYNKSAEHLVNHLRKVDGEKALKVVELGIGINPAHKGIIGKIIHDEKIFGSVHIAFGGWGDQRKCKIHEDVILLKPTVLFDNKIVIKNGKIL